MSTTVTPGGSDRSGEAWAGDSRGVESKLIVAPAVAMLGCVVGDVAPELPHAATSAAARRTVHRSRPRIPAMARSPVLR
jgi:hypothetical protein